ncbi:dirigent protein 22-like [Cynara cardunculus var. scolymus]|uniref:Dirigent protein n=1 Tax=Cynara cardunculus var. scolymus TaxID=59895 RepID=A0A103XDU2_CYNCS|nr:dirigent protein 22-like [Cynara cardunculus var. scolymus]KVH88920.1 Plant disease resistance response protein [Cynara cardunculus var. scolymus]
MVKIHLTTQFIITILLLHILTSIQSKSFSRNLSRKSLDFKKEKLTHLHFYFHDIVIARHPTAIKVASSPTTNTSSSFFGLVMMMDDPLTLTPEPGSKVLGRAQGIYASADLKELGFLMVLNYCFTEGKYNGSTLSILGRNAAFTSMREMPVVGGSGLFRFARGYAQAKTHSLDYKTGNAVVEYDVFVLHY